MGGGYIQCGHFSGEDKSGSALSGVFEALQSRMLPQERESWNTDFLSAIEEEAEEQTMEIRPHLIPLLYQPLKTYYEDLGAKLGYPIPFEAPELDRQSGLDMTDAKWGAGDGWRYYCAHDLLRACEESLQTGEGIIISFD
jgi:hypothetical protein